MKKKYEKFLWNMYDNMRQIPLAISGIGSASAYAGSYINAYRDMEPAWQYMFVILDGLKNIEVYENIINTNPDCDKAEMKSGIEHYLKAVEDASRDFDDFIRERAKNDWK